MVRRFSGVKKLFERKIKQVCWKNFRYIPNMIMPIADVGVYVYMVIFVGTI